PLIPQTPLKLISICSHLTLTRIPSQSISPQTNAQYPIPNVPPNPTYHHSHIFQKVLANAFLLFTRAAVKY
ncbi:hypothetical protein, partial [Klebsiella variicola]|uniref:hypothetical protein n=1 Tax=Klebsiella variicola TaxID=244366 RepID=UPI001E28C9BA